MPQNAFASKGFFTETLAQSDLEVHTAVKSEFYRQQNEIELIASENIVSKAVLETVGTVLTNKYAEGYPGRRYYGGCQFVDVLENLAIERAKALFKCNYANVQPNSGSQANQAVFLALMKPGDTFMGLDLNSGGHLTHGSKVNVSGKWFNAVSYGVAKPDCLIDVDEVEDIARRIKPKLIVAGGSSYSRYWDFKRFRKIADTVGAYLLVDMAHFAGLVAGGSHPNPIPHAHVVTSTTHKTLRGPRGGIILTNDKILAQKFNSAIFPGIQGGPLMHVVAAKAVAFGEALTPEFKAYTKQIVLNSKTLATSLQKANFDIVTGGTDNHLILLDLLRHGLTGKDAEAALGRANITCNKNSIPFDPQKPAITSGIRLGTPAGTTRGFGLREFENIAGMIAEVLNGLIEAGPDCNSATEQRVKNEVVALCNRFPIYQ
ncbi:MAG: Serine hydroxymethyltransferase 2 [Hyphomicrobiaceae bacterium hypho_1]